MKPQRKRRAYRFFEDAGHGWLEVPRREVEASGAVISQYSYLDPATNMVYLEEDCDIKRFLRAARLDWRDIEISEEVFSSRPRQFPGYDLEVAA
jgi:hypothetical protein